MDTTSPENYVRSKVSGRCAPEVTNEELVRVYDDWAETYEQDNEERLDYRAPDTVAAMLCELYPAPSRHTPTILDVGAGTGILGTKLRDHGFVHIDALDPSSNMLNEARKRNLYERYYCEYITGDPLDIDRGWYDVVTGVGMLGDNHAPFSAIHEMIRVTKAGGHVILALRRSLILQHSDYKDLEPLMEQLEIEGQWQKISQSVFPNYYTNTEGVLYVYLVL